MTFKQKNLLYKICFMYSKRFYLSFKEDIPEYNADYESEVSKINKEILELEQLYKNKYGELPDWKDIEDVWKTRDSLLGGNNDE